MYAQCKGEMMAKRSLFCCCLLLVICLLLGCQPITVSPKLAADEDPMPKTSTQDPAFASVEVDLFSGQPNPKWEMSQEQADHFYQMLQQRSTIVQAELFDGLGYRGFIIETAPAPESGGRMLVSVQGGIIKVVESTGQQIIYYEDTNQELEKWLFEQSQQYLDQELRALVEATFSN